MQDDKENESDSRENKEGQSNIGSDASVASSKKAKSDAKTMSNLPYHQQIPKDKSLKLEAVVGEKYFPAWKYMGFEDVERAGMDRHLAWFGGIDLNSDDEQEKKEAEAKFNKYRRALQIIIYQTVANRRRAFVKKVRRRYWRLNGINEKSKKGEDIFCDRPRVRKRTKHAKPSHCIS